MGEEFEPCLGEVGNLTQKYQVFPESTSVSSSDMEVFKGKSSLSPANEHVLEASN